MKEIGYGNGGDKRLEEKLKVARARYAELQAKVAKEQERNADNNVKSEPKKESKKKPKKRSTKSKRSSSRK